MNLIRQREDLKRAAEVGVIGKAGLELALSSPVFQWWGTSNRDAFTKDEMEFISSYLMDHIPFTDTTGKAGHAIWPKFYPYPCFRVSCMDIPIYDQWWFDGDEFMCFHCDDEHSHKEVKAWTVHRKHKNEVGKWAFGVWTNEKELHIPGPKDWGDRDEVHDLKCGKIHMMASYEDMSRFATSVVRILSVFLFDIYGSGNTVVKVSPKPDHTKSVQWRLAREHYLVLRRQHVEKLRESKGNVSDEDIIRSAHWRRAHLRRLSAGRFVNKRGLLVPVKRAWVGPTEWEGKDGKVYTVVGIQPPSLTGIS